MRRRLARKRNAVEEKEEAGEGGVCVERGEGEERSGKENGGV